MKPSFPKLQPLVLATSFLLGLSACGGSSSDDDGDTVVVNDSNGQPVQVSTTQGRFSSAGSQQPPAGSNLSGYSYANGFFSLQIGDLAFGESTTLTITLPAGSAVPNKLVKCINNACADYPASINGTTITFSLTDGGAGDADGQANGVITDPVGPAVDSNSGGSGGQGGSGGTGGTGGTAGSGGTGGSAGTGGAGGSAGTGGTGGTGGTAGSGGTGGTGGSAGSGGSAGTSCGPVTGATYNACVTRTTLGIPHIKADNFGSAGYGYGYAFAEDNLCVLMNDLVTIRGERSKFFGPDGRHVIIPNGSVANNVDSDFFWKFINMPSGQDVRAPWQKLRDSAVPDLQAVTTGFVAGFNRYIDEISNQGMHADRHQACRGKPWLAPITEADMYRRYYRLSLIASSSVFVTGIATAQPPDAPPVGSGDGGGGGGTLCAPAAFPAIGGECSPVDPTASASGKTSTQPSKAAMVAALKKDAGPLAAFQQANKDKFGSNMYALGPEATSNGVPQVFGNPHFPWSETERLYISHITIPGKIDMMGSSLYGVPAILIGFNRHFAWSHTVSTAYRFTFYELTVNPSNPTQYLYDGALRDMVPYEVEVEVQGESAKRKRTLYRSHLGPMLVFSTAGVPVLTWTNGKAYTLRDANAENDRLINQFAKWNQATSLDEFINLHKTVLGIPWVNTVASGPGGKAYYGDVSVVPHVTDAQIQTCAARPLHDALQQVVRGLPVLDGSRSACEWGDDTNNPDGNGIKAPVKGIFGPKNLPTQLRNDWVHNCNDSYWLTNPAQPITGYNSIIGAEGTERSLRTRLCILQVQRHLDAVAGNDLDSDGDRKFSADLGELEDTVLSSHILSAELARDTLVDTVCQSPQVITESGPVDISQACAVLASWNRSGNLNAKGAHIWREFWRRAAPNPAGVGPNPLLWATRFSVDDPVNTPRDLNPLNVLFLQRALGQAVQRVQASGFALDAPMSEIQKSGVHSLTGQPDIAIPGGEGHEGAFTIVSTGSLSDSGYRVTYGNSYIQTVTWQSNNPAGADPIAHGFVTYSQSTDPASPHFRDFTEAYSKKQWKHFPYTDAEIQADKLGSMQLSGS